MTNEKKDRDEILKSVSLYCKKYHKRPEFKAGESFVNYGGRIYDDKEMINLVDSALDFWLTAGRYCEAFENKFAKLFGVKYVSLVNSGSSANLLAFNALTAKELGARRIKRGDEVITVAAGFPTTITPIIQYGAIPVFVDISIPSYNIDAKLLEKALSKKTKAVMLAHTLGNPFNIKTVTEFCKKNNLWLIEDNCDALGSKYDGKYTGTFGDIATSSFYPPHHITMGEGGAVYTNNLQLHKLINSYRDWGRDCWCNSGKDNTCKCRFTGTYGELPKGYDHKYVYSHFGYNLKATEMQASIGLAQLDKLSSFVKARQKNWDYLHNKLSKYSDKLILPEAEENSEPSWFGFLITVKDNAGFTRSDIVSFLENHKIQTRMLFSGNIIKHPCFTEMRNNKEDYRVLYDLENTDKVMNSGFWIGVYPGMSSEVMCYIADCFDKFFEKISVSRRLSKK